MRGDRATFQAGALRTNTRSCGRGSRPVLSIHTVERHVNNAYAQIGAHNRADPCEAVFSPTAH